MATSFLKMLGKRGLSNEISVSFDCMEGLAVETINTQLTTPQNEPDEVEHESISCSRLFVAEIEKLFALKNSKEISFEEFVNKMTHLMRRVDFTTSTLNRYTFWDHHKPYTRNLIATDGQNYALLLLCWTNGKESKIHDHPGEGCFMKTIRGCIRESRYSMDAVTGEIIPTGIKFLSENQVAFISDSIGLHQIANPSPDMGAVSLHLYTPPFKACRVWLTPLPNESKIRIEDAQLASIGFFSVFGVRTPHLEGTQSQFVRVMTELLSCPGSRIELLRKPTHAIKGPAKSRSFQ